MGLIGKDSMFSDKGFWLELMVNRNFNGWKIEVIG